MSERTRNRINAAFDDELSAAPVPAGLRALSIRDAVKAPPRRSVQPQLLVVVATIVVIAVVATFVIGSHVLRATPLPAKPSGSTIPPAPRSGAASTFDPAHGVLLIFGGGTGPNPPTNETWTWDGKYWRELHPTVSPPGTRDAVMAFDSAHGNVVLYGGDMAAVNNTWTWDGTTWRQMHPKHQPPLGASSMQFDPITRSVLLYAMRPSTGQSPVSNGEVWSWNGSDWQQVAVSNSATGPAAIVSDGNQLLLLAPGMIGGRYITQTSAWTGNGWASLDPSVNLPVAGDVSAAYDPGLKQLVLLTSETWTWDGFTWMRQHPTRQPQAPGYMAYVPALHQVVSWADRTASVDNEMFGWDGSNWNLIQPGTVAWPVTNGKGGFNVLMTPEQAAAVVRATVKNTKPVLLPMILPSGGPWDVRVDATADDFNLQYESDQRDKEISFGIVVANPPPATGPHADGSRVKFRNALAPKFGQPGYADSMVYDTTDPHSQRWLMWTEPGTMSPSAGAEGFGGPGVPYFLSATGLTDQEFWQIANSLQ